MTLDPDHCEILETLACLPERLTGETTAAWIVKHETGWTLTEAIVGARDLGIKLSASRRLIALLRRAVLGHRKRLRRGAPDPSSRGRPSMRVKRREANLSALLGLVEMALLDRDRISIAECIACVDRPCAVDRGQEFIVRSHRRVQRVTFRRERQVKSSDAGGNGVEIVEGREDELSPLRLVRRMKVRLHRADRVPGGHVRVRERRGRIDHRGPQPRLSLPPTRNEQRRAA